MLSAIGARDVVTEYQQQSQDQSHSKINTPLIANSVDKTKQHTPITLDPKKMQTTLLNTNTLIKYAVDNFNDN